MRAGLGPAAIAGTAAHARGHALDRVHRDELGAWLDAHVGPPDARLYRLIRGSLAGRDAGIARARATRLRAAAVLRRTLDIVARLEQRQAPDDVWRYDHDVALAAGRSPRGPAPPLDVRQWIGDHIEFDAAHVRDAAYAAPYRATGQVLRWRNASGVEAVGDVMALLHPPAVVRPDLTGRLEVPPGASVDETAAHVSDRLRTDGVAALSRRVQGPALLNLRAAAVACLAAGAAEHGRQCFRQQPPEALLFPLPLAEPADAAAATSAPKCGAAAWADVWEMIADPFLLQVVQAYLGGEPVSMGASVFATVGPQDPEAHGWKFGFHSDYELTRFVKVFVYLTDVDAATTGGVHSFLRGSHRWLEPAAALLRAARGWFSHSTQHNASDVVAAYGGSGAVVSHEGPAGTVFVEDTMGVHVGGHMRPGAERLVLELEYASSSMPAVSGSSPRPVAVCLDDTVSDAGLREVIRARVAAYPRLFARYDIGACGDSEAGDGSARAQQMSDE